MILQATSIADLFIAETEPRTDSRGQFARWFCCQELAKVLGSRSIRQINHSRTASVGALRGMHFQSSPNAEMKMVRCLKGKVFDVAVDLRMNSSTFLCWHGEELSPENARMMVIPEGFAHGFQVLEANSELLYLHTAMYCKQSERGVRFDDSRIGIQWPLPISEISDRDRNHPLLSDSFLGL